MIHLKSVVTRVGKLLGVLAIMVFLFWLLPVIVAKNVGGAAELLSRFPGISPNGGLVSGVVTFVYPLAILFALATVVTVAGLAMDDTQGGVDTPGEGVEENNDGSANGDVNNGSETDPEDNESEEGGESAEVEYSDLVGYMIIQVYEQEKADWNLLDDGTLTIYDPEGNQMHQEQITDRTTENASALHLLRGFEPEQNYTASVTDVQGWPSVNVSFDPADYDNDRHLNIVVGYNTKPAGSHRAVYIEDFSDIEGQARFLSGGYSVYAENGDAVRKTTNAEYGATLIDDTWLDVTYTDGQTGETYFYRGDDWELDPEKQLTGVFTPPKQRFPNYTTTIDEATDSTAREYMGRQTLDSTGVELTVPNAPVEEHMPPVSEAGDAHDGRVVDVYYFERWSKHIKDARFYVDVETKQLLRAEYGDFGTVTGDPIWVTIDYWDHGEVESVEEYDADELGR